MACELGTDAQVARLGPPELRQILADLDPATGDVVLDALVVEARTRYLSRHAADEQIGLEKLWDAFERLKTVEPGRDKKAQVAALFDRVGSGPMRDVVEAEATVLTHLGNNMQIRHFETDKASLLAAEVDYLFGRMAVVLVLVHVLRQTGRLKV